MFGGQIPSLQELVMMIPAVLMGFTFHEFAHAITATWFGDDLPRLKGRVTLNPLVHLDILGTLLVLVAGIGWARPVEVNVSRLKPRVLGDIVVSLAGVIMNFLLATLFVFLALLSAHGLLFGLHNPVLTKTLYHVYEFNLWLAGFNLIPLPPLDGFRVARYLFPASMDNVVATLYRFGPFILMALFMWPGASEYMAPIYNAIESAIYHIVLWTAPGLLF